MSTSPRPRGRPKAFHSKQAQNTIQSLDRAIEVLEHIARHGSQTLSEIAASMGQSPATIYRVLTTFEARGLVEADSLTQSWGIGPACFRIGSAFLRRTSVMERARPFMRSLMETTGETVNLGIRRGSDVVFLSQVETHLAIRAFIPPGTKSPLHASGIGKALLSTMEPERIAQMVGPGALERFTPKTLPGLDALVADMAVSRARGYAVDDEERTEGMRCIAAPIRDVHGDAVAGISVSGPSHRIGPGDLRRLGELVKLTARELSHAIGAAPEDGESPLRD